MLSDLTKAGLLQHVVEFGEGVGVACRRRCQHDQAEAGRLWRGNAIDIWNKFDDRDTTAGPKSGINLFQEGYASGRIEVMKEIWDQYDIVIFSQLDLEGAAGDRAEAICETGRPGVSARHFQHWRPIERDELRQRMLLSDRDSIHAVARRDIEDSRWTRGVEREQAGEQLRRRSHHWRHPARKIYPDRMLRRHRAFCRLGGATFAHRCGQFLERSPNRG